MFQWNSMTSMKSAWTSMKSKHLASMRTFWMRNRMIQMAVAKKWNVVLILMALLLGRAVILDQFTPFALAFFAAIYYLRKEIIVVAGAALLCGSLLNTAGHTGILLAEMALFLIIQKGLEKYERAEISFAPLVVFVSALLINLALSFTAGAMTWFALVLVLIEAVLALILTLIFLQSIPVLTLNRKNYHLKNEEIICLIILLASVMTGMVGWMVYMMAPEHVLSRYLILLFAFVGGAPLGASVGVVTGLILSLANVQAIYQISLLAFAGMLAGMLKEGGRAAVAFGMLIGSSILTLYAGASSVILQSTWESVIAIALFMLTPASFLRTLAKYVPGTREHLNSQVDYARRVRDVVAGRVEQFSEVFKQLSSSFKQIAFPMIEGRAEEQADSIFEMTAKRTCASCWRRNQCWDSKLDDTYHMMIDMLDAIESGADSIVVRKDWHRHCVKADKLLDVMKQEFHLKQHDLYWKKQILDSRQLVADQLSGVSQVMIDLASEIKRESQEMFLQEEQIRSALEELGLSIHHIDIVCLDEGNVEIEIIHTYNKGYDESRKIIAPLLSDILGENIAVKSEQNNKDGYVTVLFGSAKEYEVETGVAGTAKGGELLSGDSFSAVELGNGKFALAISDGMGNGERAHSESKAALEILQQLLRSGMDEKLAVKSVNSVLLLRSPDEMFATIDMALIDLYNANTTFMKIGSTPSFIRRGKEVIQIAANNLPVGILHEIEVDLVSVQLKPGDTLIMMTDGIYDAPGPAVNKDLWLKRIIQELETEDAQEIADCLLETVVRYQGGEIHDDMTVVVAKLQRHHPEWATFRWPGLAHFERPKTVS